MFIVDYTQSEKDLWDNCLSKHIRNCKIIQLMNLENIAIAVFAHY